MADVRPESPLRPPRVGLLASVATVDLNGVRWQRGVEWLPEMHPTTSEAYRAFAIGCDDAYTGISHGSDDKPALEQAYPFGIEAMDWCSSLDVGRDFAGRARRLLEATQSFLIAREFWAGAIRDAQPTPETDDTWLAKAGADEVTTSALAPHKALAKLDAAVADYLRNGRGMIHMQVETLDRLVAEQALVRDGQQWTTPFGNLVVADAGYTGVRDGEAADSRWMVATTMVEVALSEIDAMRFDDSVSQHAALDHTVNDVKVYARRAALVMHEPNLLHAAAQVDLS